MLEELRNLNTPCGKKEILYFLTKVLGNRSVSRKDVKILCSPAPGMKIDVEATLKYGLAFSWISVSRGITVSENLLSYLDDDELLNSKLIEYTVRKLFDEGIFSERSFSFNIVEKVFQFRNEILPLGFSAIRNVLLNQEFLVAKKINQIAYFYVAKKYEKLLARFIKGSRIKLTLEGLRKKLEGDALAGEKAEQFVLAYEKARLGRELAERVQLISEIDVCAGYDIISFIDSRSTDYDCYIEVKAVSHDMEFYWSKNEYETAKLHGSHYRLYLVDLSKTTNDSYQPYIMVNPAEIVMKSDEWILEPQSFHIKKAL